ncbi:extracellular solute-binding protein [Paenibacillus mesophilus]|uniref:ABC transporter substrate-binding protein n=1 Tax=Paenibacillus mesophilus TaxID=2582849 RepID=UPI00110E467E|nr:extracellular solute-binding protein [Paenibacillus mesophilus]TMV48405.1 extracellular solute-binding protein [Paenibacillus mesophilus]
MRIHYWKRNAALLLACASVAMTAGCGGADKGQSGQAAADPAAGASKSIDTSPVTLTLFLDMTFGPEDNVNKLIIEPVKKKYPHIMLEVIKRAKGSMLTDLVAQGKTPDLIYNWSGELPAYKELDLLYDLTPLAKTAQVDLNRFDPATLESIRLASGGTALHALPFEVSGLAMFYNKDLFDKFGVAYPKDGMTWDQTVELGKKLSRVEDGKPYRGLSADVVDRLAQSLSLTSLDGKSERASVNNDGWKKIFDLAKTIWSLPNNKPEKLNDTGQKTFLIDKTLALAPTNNILYGSAQYLHPSTGLNWDVVQYPSFKEQPNVFGYVITHVFAITKTSKHKEQAMQVLDVLTSPDVQRTSVRWQARLTPLKDPELQKQLGADVDYLKDKHLTAFLMSKPSAPVVYSRYEGTATGITRKKFAEYFDGKDVNTALREAEEEINAEIAKLKQK